jgi:multiple sugar transport system permease protein
MATSTAERRDTRPSAPGAPAAQEAEKPRGRRVSFEGKMLAPALILLAALSLFPFVYIIFMSLTRVGLIGGLSFHWAGVDNWTRLFSDSAVGSSWLRSIVYFVLTVGLELILGIAIALCVHEMVWGKNIALSLILMPMFMAPVIVGLLGRFLTDSTYGLYAWVLKETGLYSGDILGSTKAAFAAVTLMDVWQWTPLIALIVLAGLASMPGQVLEAAKVDGATYWQRLRHIVLPMIAGVIVVALLIRSMDAIRYFDIIQNTTNGGPADATKIVPIRLYDTAFRFFDLGYAAAIGLSMLAVSILVANLFLKTLHRRGLAK